MTTSDSLLTSKKKNKMRKFKVSKNSNEYNKPYTKYSCSYLLIKTVTKNSYPVSLQLYKIKQVTLISEGSVSIKRERNKTSHLV